MKRVYRKLLALACAAVMALSALPAAAAAPAFSDVGEGDWFHPYVTMVSEAGLMAGSEGSFHPQGNLTAAEALVLAYQLHSQGQGQLPDVEGPWYMPYYQYAVTSGILSGDELAAEDLNQYASRYQMVSILDKAAREDFPAINQAEDGVNPPQGPG